MVESNLEAESCEDSGTGDTQSGIHKPVLRREPSFSRWCDEDGIEQPDRSSDDADVGIAEDADFELPLLQVEASESGKFQQRTLHLNGGANMEDASIYMDGNRKGKKYVPFDVENMSSRETRFPEFKDEGGKLESKLETGRATQSCISMAALLRTLFYILVWYTFSTCLTLYNKTLLGDKLGKFPAPFLMNTIHFGMQAVVSKAIVRFCSQKLQPSVTMSWRDYFIRVVPTAIGAALDINLSNISLVFISVTFATMCKSASPIFLLLFAFVFKLERPSIELLGIIFVISVGVLLTVAKETQFEFWGFVFVMLAAVMSGFRWSMTQILLQKEAYGLKHPITFMSYVTPIMAVATGLLSLMMDPWQEFKRNDYFSNSSHIFRTCLVLLIGGALAFFMVLTEYILVSTTSAVTVTIAGVVKEAVTILVAVFYFHDQFTVLKGIGLIIIMIGVSLFNWYKYQKIRKGHRIGIDEETWSPALNGSANYVILDDADDQEDDAGTRLT